MNIISHKLTITNMKHISRAERQTNHVLTMMCYCTNENDKLGPDKKHTEAQKSNWKYSDQNET